MIHVERERVTELGQHRVTERVYIECEDWHPESELAPWLAAFHTAADWESVPPGDDEGTST